MRKNIWSIAIGLVLAVIGVGILGNALFNWNFKIFIEGWWALALMIVSLGFVVKEGPKLYNVASLIIFGFLFLRYHVPALEKIDLWTLVVGVIILCVAAQIIINAINP
ncbi:MAG: hypothetical protein MJ236_07535, partial [Clostridia bacterium]|nr:hypothetical protein [Clostridia bacterium]